MLRKKGHEVARDSQHPRGTRRRLPRRRRADAGSCCASCARCTSAASATTRSRSSCTPTWGPSASGAGTDEPAASLAPVAPRSAPHCRHRRCRRRGRAGVPLAASSHSWHAPAGDGLQYYATLAVARPRAPARVRARRRRRSTRACPAIRCFSPLSCTKRRWSCTRTCGSRRRPTASLDLVLGAARLLPLARSPASASASPRPRSSRSSCARC